MRWRDQTVYQPTVAPQSIGLLQTSGS